MSNPLKTIIIGFGQISTGFSEDPEMAKHFKYATHAQVLADNEKFSLEAVVDPSDKAIEIAKSKWRIPIAVKNIEELPKSFSPEIAVIATPPDCRKEILSKLPSLKGIILEKPIGTNIKDSQKFVNECKNRGLTVQVNFWRRGDEFFQKLANGELEKMIGKPQVAFGLYGNGLKNNGSHLIDFAKMLFGNIKDISVPFNESAYLEGPIKNDVNISFSLNFSDNINVAFQPVPFKNYREVGIDIWGEKGRLALLQESLGIYYYPKSRNRGLLNEFEIASDNLIKVNPTCGMALFRLYDNLFKAIKTGENLWSTLDGAMIVDEVIHNILSEI
ncbi:MAG: Gfo/Idh/MocA family oxidoreductase [Desulfobacterales bacterium]|nr:Gfo/Idh/MocA family oxidoreductase [Desulfobacterales bacterium]